VKIFSNLVAITFLITGLSGCVIVGHDGRHGSKDDWEVEQAKNQSVINQLEISDSRQTIFEQLGAPDFSEAFTKDKDTYRILFYRTQRTSSDGLTSKDETTPLIFKNEKLVGWGDDALSTVRANLSN